MTGVRELSCLVVWVLYGGVGQVELELETTKWYKLTEAAEARCSRAAAARDVL